MKTVIYAIFFVKPDAYLTEDFYKMKRIYLLHKSYTKDFRNNWLDKFKDICYSYFVGSACYGRHFGGTSQIKDPWIEIFL